MIKRLLFVVLFLGVVAAGGAYWAFEQVKASADTELTLSSPQIFTVSSGTHLQRLFRQLENEGLMQANPFRRYVGRLHPEWVGIKAGTYQLTPGMSLDDAIDLFVSGDEHQFSITLLEGERFSEWLTQLRSNEQLAHETAQMSEAEIADILGYDGDKLEGVLLPETYFFTVGESDLDILKRAYVAMESLLADAWEDRDDALELKSEYELLIMASIIEKETALAAERGLVSSVFNNRLRIGMRLQTDPTVIYGMGDDYNGVITRSALRKPTAYNTYTIDGLPPTPIAMPSKESVLAAANPDESKYLYFVADTHGGHTFTTNLRDHNRAVKVYRQWERSQN
uniref:endolytic transglycosylase MltG n=1 Tax=Thaumasiovibrio occultus TaxID=1891184 RepID=UPI000B3623D7|nr:endolytic transglycosylase MltG [Thaumasiovibrio occultus]